MIAACPSCGARYRIDTAKLRPEGARLRCSRCENVFRVRAPEPPPRESNASAAKPFQTPLARMGPAHPARETRREPEREARESPPPLPAASRSERLVLIAHPEVEAGRRIAAALGSWGLETIVVHDGVEAILNIQRELPRVVVLDAALPKMFGFQVCELLKRNDSLRVIHVILVGAIHQQDRYRRPPRDLYGADAYVERHQLPQALGPLFEGFGLALRAPKEEARSAPELSRTASSLPPQPVVTEALQRAPLSSFEKPEPLARPQPTAPPQPIVRSEPMARPQPVAPPEPIVAPEPAPVDPALAAETEQAERLARIIVSDVVLYNPEKFDAGVQSGNVVQALASELEEGRSLFAQRVDPRVGDPGEFLEQELLRVARGRGMK